MFRLKNVAFLSCLLICFALNASIGQAQSLRGITPEDYFAFEFISDPNISPDGKLVAYVVTKIDRAQNRHVAFGFGVHQCLGLQLARMEMKAFFAELLSRVDHIELAGEPAWIESSIVSGPKHLPIRYAMRK